KQARDKFWSTDTAEQVRDRLFRELGYPITSVDVAFDCCLTRTQGQFTKRDLFLASSDLARSLIVVCGLALIPAARLIFTLQFTIPARLAISAGFVALLYFTGRLCWTRMKRFRALSETPVFNSYLAAANINPLSIASAAA